MFHPCFNRRNISFQKSMLLLTFIFYFSFLEFKYSPQHFVFASETENTSDASSSSSDSSVGKFTENLSHSFSSNQVTCFHQHVSTPNGYYILVRWVSGRFSVQEVKAAVA
jgi:hypothetical protein